MPIYEYRCEACGEEFEVLQRFSDRPLTRCRECGGRLEKLLSRSSFILKGGGWYADGYGRARSKGARSAGKSGKDGRKGASGNGGSKGGSSDSSGPAARRAAAAAASR